MTDDTTAATPDDGVDGTDDVASSDTDRIHRATIEFGLTTEQADAFQTVIDAADSIAPAGPADPVDDDGSDPTDVDLDAVAAAFVDPVVAEAVWTRWGDDDRLGRSLDPFVDRLLDQSADSDSDSRSGGVAWLGARHRAWFSRTDEAIALLDAARSSGHPLVLCELAALEADRSDASAARELLREAGVDVDVDLDSEYDPVTADLGFGAELAEEIAPFAQIRPKPMAGRNDRCPCGSGRKYKQCHLGNELHALDDRAGWLYVKLMRFIGVNNPLFPAVIGDDVVDAVTDDEMRRMLHESYLPVDLALFEGGVAEWFLEAKRSLLPADEVEMLRGWIDATRSVYEVARSRPGAMDVIDLATRERVTVVDTVPDEPLETGWRLIGRLVPVGDSFRAYGGFLPINDDMVDSMLEAFATRRLETVAIAIGQIFETAATQDEMQDVFDGSLDTTELEKLMAELGVTPGDVTDDPPTE